MTRDVVLHRPVDASYHHNSHRQLLDTVAVVDAPPANIDAVIVPTARPVHWLREAMSLARELGCVLVAMCSRSVRAAEVADLGAALGVTTLAVDTAAGTRRVLPVLSTAELLSGRDYVDHFGRNSDTSHKRNLALVLARLAGWERVLFLDDDMFKLRPSHARAAAGLLDTYQAVGLDNAGYPDNSVVCHVHRETGGRQAHFIGVGALLVAPLRTRSFFPDVYNQDWFFLLGEGQPPRVAVTGEVRQKFYNPFADPDRARREELGDCLAEGLYWLLDHRLPLNQADAAHWRDFLYRRTYFIEQLLSRVGKDGDSRRDHRVASLEEAQRTCAKIVPSLCEEYVRRWRDDLRTWRSFVDAMPTAVGTPDDAVATLGLRRLVCRS